MKNTFNIDVVSQSLEASIDIDDLAAELGEQVDFEQMILSAVDIDDLVRPAAEAIIDTLALDWCSDNLDWKASVALYDNVADVVSEHLDDMGTDFAADLDELRVQVEKLVDINRTRNETEMQLRGEDMDELVRIVGHLLNVIKNIGLEAQLAARKIEITNDTP